MTETDELKAEYLLIQQMYEAYDQRALSLKALAAPLLGAGLAAAFSQRNAGILLATFLVAVCLWFLEGMWKAFQYCLRRRIEILEEWFRGPRTEKLAPFQIYTSWGESWRAEYGHLRGQWTILWLPFVFLPYAAIALCCIAFAAWFIFR